MSELLIATGHWNGPVAAEIECFLETVCMIMGLTQKRADYLKQIYKDIHGSFKPDEFYMKSVENCRGLFPSIVLDHMIMKHCNPTQKKQLKIWYTELLAIEPMNEEPIIAKIMLPVLSNTINTF